MDPEVSDTRRKRLRCASEFIIRCSMFDVGRSKNALICRQRVFFSRRNGRTFPGPSLEAVGLDQTKGS